jgi:hypothetical protein
MSMNKPVSFRNLSISIMIFEYSLGKIQYVLYFVAKSGLADINHMFSLFGCKNSNSDILFNSIPSFIILIIIDLSGFLFKPSKLGMITSRSKSLLTCIFLSDGSYSHKVAIVSSCLLSFDSEAIFLIDFLIMVSIYFCDNSMLEVISA